jgi:hypothetical protein
MRREKRRLEEINNPEERNRKLGLKNDSRARRMLSLDYRMEYNEKRRKARKVYKEKYGMTKGQVSRLRNDDSLDYHLGIILRVAKSRAKRKNVIFDLTKEDLKSLYDGQKGFCAITGLEMGIKFNADDKMSLDRIVPEKGYVPENIQFLTLWANQCKWDLPIGKLVLFARGILNKYEDMPEGIF